MEHDRDAEALYDSGIDFDLFGHHAEAAGVFRVAAEDGDVRAAISYAVMLVEGRGVRQDVRRGMRILWDATFKARHPDGMYNYAACLLHSTCDEQQHAAAHGIMECAAAFGHPEARDFVRRVNAFDPDYETP